MTGDAMFRIGDTLTFSGGRLIAVNGIAVEALPPPPARASYSWWHLDPRGMVSGARPPAYPLAGHAGSCDTVTRAQTHGDFTAACSCGKD